MREHRAERESDPQVRHALIGADPLEQVEPDRGAGRRVVGDEDDLVAECLDDAPAVGGDDLTGNRLESVDELGELALRQAPNERREADHVGESDGPHRAGALDLPIVRHEPTDRGGEVAPPRVDEERLDVLDEGQEQFAGLLGGLGAQLVVPQALVALALGGEDGLEIRGEIGPLRLGSRRVRRAQV